jgi:hypothetical protein
LDDAPAIYAKSSAGADRQLDQGEILSDLVHVHIEVPSLVTPPLRVIAKQHPLAIILSQGCDLEQDFFARLRGETSSKVVPTILFCEVMIATDIYNTAEVNKRVWDQIKINKHERYHFFQAVGEVFDAMGSGLAECVADFKRFFAVPADEVYERIRSGGAKRRCSLASPYLEHFSHRFANFLSRVALPQDHASA